MCDEGEFLLIAFLDAIPVKAPHRRVVVKVAFNPPGFIKNLFPFGARIELHLETAQFNFSVTDFLTRTVIQNAERWSRSINDLVSGKVYVIARDAGKKHGVFAFHYIVDVYR